MATGGFKSTAATDFLEEWKAKREKMRAKMLGDIAAATGAPLGSSGTANSTGNSRQAPAAAVAPGTELTNNGNPERSASSGNCLPSSYSVARSSSGTTLKRAEEETHHQPAAPHPSPAAVAPSATASSIITATAACNLKKAPPQTDKASCPCPSPNPDPGSPNSPISPMACNDSDKESPSPGKGKEKKSSGHSARKGKGQIEKRKLREKRRSTGVVSMPSNESLDELDDDDAGEKDRREEELVLANTFQNEAMAADPAMDHLMDTPRCGSGRPKSSSAGAGSEEEAGGNSRQRHNRHGRDGGGAAAAAVQGSLEKRMEELERELSRERQENNRLVKAQQDKDDLIGKLKEEIDLLNRDLDDIEDENEQLKQENKTLLKVVGQLTR